MNAASEGARKLLASHEALLEGQSARDLMSVMSTREGRRFVWSLLGDAGVFKQSFSGDALSTAFNEGSRSFGLRLLSRLMEEPEPFLKAQSESLEAQKVHQNLVQAAEAESKREQEENETE